MLSTIICKDKKEFFKPFVEIKNGKIKTHKFTKKCYNCGKLKFGYNTYFAIKKEIKRKLGD